MLTGDIPSGGKFEVSGSVDELKVVKSCSRNWQKGTSYLLVQSFYCRILSLSHVAQRHIETDRQTDGKEQTILSQYCVHAQFGYSFKRVLSA